jgi:hypothetical protein
MTDEQFAAWPKCAVPACPNKCCLRLRSKYCWPHTPGDAGEAADNLRETEPTPAGVAASDGSKR